MTLNLGEMRRNADLSFAFLIIYPLIAEMKSVGLAPDPFHILSIQLTHNVVASSLDHPGHDTARLIDFAKETAQFFVAQAESQPQVAEFLETLWNGVRAYVYGGGQQEVLAAIAPLYRAYVLNMWVPFMQAVGEKLKA